MKYKMISIRELPKIRVRLGQTGEQAKNCRLIKSIRSPNSLSLLSYYRRKEREKREYIYRGGVNNSLYARINKKQQVRLDPIRLSFGLPVLALLDY